MEFTVVRSSPDAIEVVADDKTDTGKTGNYKQVPKLMEGGKALAKGKDVDSLPGRNQQVRSCLVMKQCRLIRLSWYAPI